MALGLLALGLALGMYISYFLCRFHLHLVVNAKPVSSGIWALVVIYLRILDENREDNGCYVFSESNFLLISFVQSSASTGMF